MDIEFYQSMKQSYEQVQEFKIADDILSEIDQFKFNYYAWIQGVNQKKGKALEEINDLESQIKEVEQRCIEQKAHVNDLEQAIEQLNQETTKLHHQKQQYLIRKNKAKAKLSPKDVDFIDSIEKRLTAYKRLTGLIWDYSNCNEDYVAGYIKDLVSKKVKFFQGQLNPDELWKTIEKVNKNTPL